MSAEDIASDYLLQENYSIDDDSFHEEEDNESHHSSTKVYENVQYLHFIQAIKDEDINRLKTIIQIHPLFINKIGLEGLNAIQYATLFSNTQSIKYLISQGAFLDSQIEGLPLVHLSLTLAMFEQYRPKAVECFKFLCKEYALQVDQRDRLGRRIIHLIIQYDLEDCIEVIDLKESDLAMKDNDGHMAFDYFYLYDSVKTLEKICEVIGVKKFYTTMKENKGQLLDECFVHHSFTIIEYLIDNGKDMIDILIEDITNIKAFYSYCDEIINNCALALDYINNTLSDSHGKNDDIDNNANGLLSLIQKKSKIPFESSINKTTLVYNNDCILHIKLPEDPVKRMQTRNQQVENSDRLCVLMQPPFGILLSDSMSKSPQYYYKETKRKSALADILRCHDISYINHIKTKCENSTEEPILIDSDTYINKHTFESIFNATGCVMEGIDLVMSKESTNAFILLRPPGHHAGYFGALTIDNQSSPISNGFCIVNNVCIGAAYCKYMYKNIIKRIAIVDFDVHHGNGTEEIISLLNKKVYRSHLTNSSLGNIDLSKTVINPWLDYNDPSNVLFISLHAYNEVNPISFYPYTGSNATNTKKTSDIYPGGILNIPLNKSMKYSFEYRNIFRTKAISRLHKFKPDIIFISAGFDGHEKENINAGLMCLNEHDYKFLTEEIQQVANKFCEGRLVSVLEGGYNVKSGIVGSFAQSVMSHAKALNSSINKAKLNEGPLCQIKRTREYNRDYENYQMSKQIDSKPRRSERIRNNTNPGEKDNNQIDNQEINDIFSYEKEKKFKNDIKEMNLDEERDELIMNNNQSNNEIENEGNVNNDNKNE